jgi:hypothetical protein
MTQRLSQPLLLAFAVGVALMLALVLLPDPGIGPSSTGLGDVARSLGGAAGIFARNLVALAILAAGGLAIGATALSRAEPHPAARTLAYLLVLAGVLWLYFSTGVDTLAGQEGVPRAALLVRLVHGYLELPALLLPWAAVVVAFHHDRRRLDWPFVVAATACGAALLIPAALVEAFVVPGLL